MEEVKARTVGKIYVQKIFIPRDLKTTPLVFIRSDRVKKQLELPY